MKDSVNSGSAACQVMANIRCAKEMTYREMADVFKKRMPYVDNLHSVYFIGFFEECRPKMILKFMSEQNITRAQILDIYSKVACFGETHKFAEALRNGEF